MQILFFIFFILLFLTKDILNVNLNLNKLNQVLLDRHNKYRKNHTVPDLSLDDELIVIAQDYSETLADHDENTEAEPYIPPSGNKNKNKELLGENIFYCKSTLKNMPCYNAESAEPVDTWYNEIKYYDYTDPGFTIGAAHFTQVVWKNSTKMGCGASVKKDGVTYKVVCNYYEAGNVLGDNEYFTENVLPPLNDTNFGNFLKFNNKYYFVLYISILFDLF